MEQAVLIVSAVMMHMLKILMAMYWIYSQELLNVVTVVYLSLGLTNEYPERIKGNCPIMKW